jgi:hypothetical protein
MREATRFGLLLVIVLGIIALWYLVRIWTSPYNFQGQCTMLMGCPNNSPITPEATTP